jgi:hypothetical protein
LKEGLLNLQAVTRKCIFSRSEYVGCPQDLEAVEDAKRKLADEPNGRALPGGFIKVLQMPSA